MLGSTSGGDLMMVVEAYLSQGDEIGNIYISLYYLLSLANSLATTAGANMTGTAIVFTHNIFTEQFIKVLQPDTSL